MPSYKTHLSGKFYKADHLDVPVDLSIKSGFSEVVQEGDTPKLCVNFEEPDTRILVINATRGEAISAIACSEDYLQWPGTIVRLQRGWTKYQGRRTPCIEVVAPTADAGAGGF